MKKKILIGSLLILTLLLLMPSIPAIQQRTIEDKAYSDLVEEFKDVDLGDIEVLDGIKHQELYDLVVFIIIFRLERTFKLINIAIEVLGNDFRIKHPLLFLRGLLLFSITIEMAYFCNGISDTLEWNWEDLVDIIILYMSYG